ncbi:hypothetical protein E4Z98_02570 [Vagococcus xieshaowenii]|uniref:Collagen-like protein n=1 Tax=Vagococcus xieshaowenii TaxID=2562451 RepID=A0AAJ5EGG5_9ENTE|nr:hypothetical protein E4Z98_02570 [Vagococcus xieshaowenii]TFZ41932.1 hypothetical protein E4031_04750 [Vagococcus xieshaowenii]
MNNIEQGIVNVELTPGPKGDKGDAGPQGEQGPAGKDGVVTQEQYDAIIARLDALEGGTA